jgi:HEPN domain-containing protein
MAKNNKQKVINKWINKAEKDLMAAKMNFQQGLYEVASFLSHQAAEKALKALYILKFKRLWKTHDLVGILIKLGGNKNIENYAKSLTDIT